MNTPNLIRFTARKDTPMTVLVVEDDPFQRSLLENLLKTLGHKTLGADDGQKALTLLNDPDHNIGVVIMDRHMPVLDGLSTVRRMKDNPVTRRIPVIMITGSTSEQDIREGIETGVFYYMAKPFQESMLRSVLLAAVREVAQNKMLGEELLKHRAGFGLIKNCQFEFKTLDEAEALAVFAAHCYPEPERVLPGLAELLTNAVEHGNLDIGYQRKTELLEAGTWRAEIERRLGLDEYAGRRVEMTILHKADGVYVVITDQGKGFDWQRYMMIDPSRAGDSHGRGIAQSKARCFDTILYNQTGNQVVAKVGLEKTLEW